MNRITLGLLLCISLKSFSQVTFPNVPVDRETKLISYSDVVDQKGVSAKDLYARANAWYLKFFNNPAEKLRKKDDETNSLEFFVRVKLYNFDKKGVKSDSGELMQYNLTLTCKDGRYRYEFTKFNLKAVSYKPAEPLLEKTDAQAERNASWIKQTDDEVKRTIHDLEKALSTSGDKKKDDW
jgi:hypothetical protein